MANEVETRMGAMLTAIILGEDYPSELNMSRIENILQSIIDNTEYDDPIYSRIEFLLLELKKVIYDDPTIEALNVTENGVYHEVGKVYDPVTVNVDTGPTIESLNVTENGTYEETGKAYSPVSVQIPHEPQKVIFRAADDPLVNYRIYKNSQCMKEITIPDDYEAIGSESFKSTGFEKIILPSNCRQIGNSAFYSCERLKNVLIPDTVNTIGLNAFQYCRVIEEIDVPANISTIPELCFSDCYELKSITFRRLNPPTLGRNVFQRCIALEHIYVPAESVDSYKVASGWSNYASIIEAIPN